jgi:hypothetical protein
MQVYGQLQNAAIEVLSSDPSSTVQGRVWYNSTTAKVMVDDGSAKSALLRNDQKAVFGTSGTAASNIRFQRGASAVLQFVLGSDSTAEGSMSTSLAQVDFREPNYTFSGKPAAGNAGRVIYVSDRSALYLDNGTQWQTVGSGSGSGSKNYLGSVNGTNINGDFELNATTGWTLFNTTLTGLVPTGAISAGAASVGTFAIVSSGQLSGTYSLNTASAAAWSAGQGFISDGWTVDASDAAKVLSFKFNYKVVSGASNGVFSGTSANTFHVYIYDVANSAWIQPAGVYGLVQNSGVGICTGTFQTPSNATSFRFAIVCANASLGAISLYWDDFFCGPQTAPIGSVATDWKAYTPTFTGFGTVSSSAVYSRRVGDTLEVHGSITVGTPTAVTAIITLGYNGVNGNVSIDTTKVGSASLVGSAASSAGASTTYFNTGVLTVGASPGQIQFGKQTSTVAMVSAYANGNDISQTGQSFHFFVKVPIVGWGSNLQLSDSTDTRVLAFRTGGNPTATVTSSLSTVVWASSPAIDTHGAYSTSTGKYTVAVSGLYEIAVQAAISGTFASTNYGQITIIQNATNVGSNIQQVAGSGTGTVYPSTSTIVNAVAGDTLYIQVLSTATSPTLVASSSTNYFTVKRLSGPSVVAATETVAAFYSYATTQSFANNTTVTMAPDTKAFDTHNAYSTGTGLFTAPVAGKYRITAFTNMTGLTASNGAMILAFIKNGSAGSRMARTAISIDTNQGINGSIVVAANAGDTLGATFFQSNGATRTNESGIGWVQFERVGN